MEYISSRKFNIEVIKKIFDTLDLWTNKIEKNENFSFIKFGDGEFFCMMGEKGQNCDKHPYSEELGKKLYDAWYFFNSIDNIYIAEWAGHKPGMRLETPFEKFQCELIEKTNIDVNFVNFEILLQNTLSENKFNFLRKIKNFKRKKIFVGPKRLFGVKNFLNVDVLIEVPVVNSFSEYTNILEKLLTEITDNSIIMFASGMPSKSFIHKALEYNKNITCLDIGSGFDAIFYRVTREGQLNPNIIKNYYKELW